MEHQQLTVNDASQQQAVPLSPDKAPSTPSSLDVSLLEQVDSPEVDASNCRLREVLIATGAVVGMAGVALVIVFSLSSSGDSRSASPHDSGVPLLGDGKCNPDTYCKRIGSGFDIRKWFNKPQADNSAVLLGFKPEFAYEQISPDDVDVTQVSSSVCAADSVDTEDMTDIQGRLSNSFSFGATFDVDPKWGLSIGVDFMRSMTKHYEDKKQVRVDWCRSTISQVELKPGARPPSQITAGLLKLKKDDSQANFEAFFQNYGTHVITRAEFGGRASITSVYDTSKCSSKEIKCAGLTLGGFFEMITGSGGGHDCTTTDQVQIINSATQTWDIWGGSGESIRELIQATPSHDAPTPYPTYEPTPYPTEDEDSCCGDTTACGTCGTGPDWNTAHESCMISPGCNGCDCDCCSNEYNSQSNNNDSEDSAVDPLPWVAFGNQSAQVSTGNRRSNMPTRRDGMLPEFSDWMDSLSCTRAMVSMELVSIGNWVNFQLPDCVDSQDLCPKAETFNSALEQYLHKYAVPQQPPPPSCVNGASTVHGWKVVEWIAIAFFALLVSVLV